MLLLLVACGESPETGTGEAADAPHAERASAAAQTPASLEELLPETLSILIQPWHGDFDGMVERRFIRTLVVSGGPQFFYDDGKPRGMVSELLVLLQREVNASLGRRHDQVEILPMPISRDQLIPALIDGQADLIAADLTITDVRSGLIDFSEPFATGIDEIVVFAPQAGEDVVAIDDLAGRDIYVRESSSYFEHLEVLNADLRSRGMRPLNIVTVDELLRVEDILEMVNAGLVNATVVDNYKASYWSAIFPEMVVRNDLVLRSGGQIAWAFRKDSPALAAVVDKFIKGHRQGTLVGNVLIERYFGNLQRVRNATSDEGIDSLRPLLGYFQSSAAENDLQPLMLAAQAYQESGLDNSRKSSAGAVGIMQIKPATAADRNVGIADISAPADNIRAGAKYMRFLSDRYFSDQDMDKLQQWLFALAAYNAGPAKIQRLRRQAAAEGYDPNRWLDNVEVIAGRKIGRETVRYVRNVFKYYVAYQLAWENGSARRSLGIDQAP